MELKGQITLWEPAIRAKRKAQVVNLIVKWGYDSAGKKDWWVHIEPPECSIIGGVHSSAYTKYPTLEEGLKDAIEWLRKMLSEDGYEKFKVIEVN